MLGTTGPVESATDRLDRWGRENPLLAIGVIGVLLLLMVKGT